MLCWMAKLLRFLSSPQNWLIPMAQMLQLLAGIRSPRDSMLGRWSVPMALPPICTGKHPSKLLIRPHGISTWLDNRTTTSQTQHAPKRNSHLPPSVLLFPAHKPEPLESAARPSLPSARIYFLNMIDKTSDQTCRIAWRGKKKPAHLVTGM